MVRNRTSTGFLKCAVGVAQSNYSRGVAQWLTRNARDLEVGGSNPPPPDGARPLNPSQTNEDTSPRHYRRSTGPWDALKYQRAGNQHSKGSKTHPRLSPAETQPSCDAGRHRPTGRPVLHQDAGRNPGISGYVGFPPILVQRQHPQAHRGDHRLKARPHVQLATQVRRVVPHRVRAQPHLHRVHGYWPATACCCARGAQRLVSCLKAGNPLDSLRGSPWPKRKHLRHAPALVVLRTNPREFWACSRYWDTPSCTFTAPYHGE